MMSGLGVLSVSPNFDIFLSWIYRNVTPPYVEEHVIYGEEYAVQCRK